MSDLTEAEKVAKIARFGFDGPSIPTPDQEKHAEHLVLAIAPHVWFCRTCLVDFDGEPDVSGSIFDKSSSSISTPPIPNGAAS